MTTTITIAVLLAVIILLFFVIAAQSEYIGKLKYNMRHKLKVEQELRTQNDHLRYYVTRKDNTSVGRQ